MFIIVLFFFLLIKIGSQRIEIKARLGYLVHLKDDLLAKQQEYQSDVSGLMTNMKNDMEGQFQKVLQETQAN